VEAGATVVDNTSFWRMHDDVPLVIAEVNPEAIDSHHGIVANPNCSTMQMVVALAPIHRAVGIERIVVSTYQSASGTGRRAVDELLNQAHALLHDEDPPAPEVYPHRLAFNVLPQVETFKAGDDYTTEERKMMAETRKILGADEEELGISATCARVPVVVGHSQSVNIQTHKPLAPEEARELLAEAPGVAVVDSPGEGLYPMAIEAAGRDDVLVGRVRRDPSAENALNLWIVGDNLRKGAATNAIQLAELLVERDRVKPS
jgi:aspartate-semialdehyde dehydrogenase